MASIQAVVNYEATRNPSWEWVSQEIMTISATGNDTVDLIVGEDDLPMMIVSGSKDGRYRVCVSTDDGSFVLVDPNLPDDEVDVTFPYHTEQSCQQRELVQQDTALQAVRAFFDKGIMHPDLTWQAA